MITVHNTDGDKVAKPVKSSIIVDRDDNKKSEPSGPTGWQAYSGKSTITYPSPTATSEEPTSDASRLSGAFMDNVNRARFTDLAIVRGTDDLSKVVAQTGDVHLLRSSAFGNWRKFKVNGFTEISQRVMLQATKIQKPEYSVNYTMDGLGDTILKVGGGIGEKLQKMSNTINGLVGFGASLGIGTGGNINQSLLDKTLPGERMALYQKMPVVDTAKTETSGGFESVEFGFKFGQAGIFSGEEEVVKPILALVYPFLLKGGGQHSFLTPFPNKQIANREALLAMAKIVSGKSGIDFNLDVGGDGVAENFITAFNSAVDKMYASMDYVAQNLLQATTSIVLCIGGLVAGPFTLENISWDFDFDNVDEYGFPCEGTVKFSKLKSLRLLLASDYIRQWGYPTESKKVDGFDKVKAVEEAHNKEATLETATKAGSKSDTM